MKAELHERIELPEGVEATIAEKTLTIKGPKGEVTRQFDHPHITIKQEGNAIVLHVTIGTKREKRMVNTNKSHIANMIQGVQEPHEYNLKVCSGHFPMNVSLQKDQLIIKNFLGEKSARTLNIDQGADVKLDGDQITIKSPNKELAGRIASDIELLTKKTGKDLRIFQDGIYITHKAGKQVSQ